jgi:hypothetical protein
MTAKNAHKLFSVALSAVKLAKQNKSKKLVTHIYLSRRKPKQKLTIKKVAWRFFLDVIQFFFVIV